LTTANLLNPLSGIKVIEVAQGVAGPHSGKILAGLGADVIKIELPPDGDWTRRVGPFISETNKLESSSLFLHNNTGKSSVLLDWRTKNGFEKLVNLTSTADILIEDWDISTRQKLSISTTFFTDKNKKLIDLCVTPFGLHGPYASFKSTPIIQFALGGFMDIMGNPNEEPLMIPGFQADYIAGLNANNAIQIALWERDISTNCGAFLEISMIESMANLHQAPFQRQKSGLRKRSGHRQSALSTTGFPPGVSTLPASDGYVTFGGGSKGIFETLCLMLNRPELSDHKDFQDVFANPDSGILFDELMMNWMEGKTKQEVFIEVSSMWLLPVSPVNTIKDIINDEQYNHKNIFQEVDHPISGIATYPTLPFTVNKTKLTVNRSPLLNEHNKELDGI
jgi:crotonobetainyl-CoA:carnitine CoA-transferase CaiB-like acyl-CoA transferase